MARYNDGMRYVDGTIFFGSGNIFGLHLGANETRRLISHLISRRVEFACMDLSPDDGGGFVVFIRNHIDLDTLRKRLPGLEFDLWGVC